MRLGKKRLCVLIVGLVAAGLIAYNTGVFAQASSARPPASPPAASAHPPASTWNPKSIAYIKASNSSKEGFSGYTVALSGDGNTLAVGAIGESSAAKGINGNQADHSALDSGAVYIYARSGATWSQQAYVKASNTDLGDQFGSSLALSSDGNTLTVGAISESSAATGINGNQADNSMESSGAVYVYTRSGAIWSQQAYVKASNTGAKDDGAEFGYAVALSGDGNTLAVGAISEASAATGINGNQGDNSAAQAGATYVFTRNGSTWSQQAYVKPWNTTARAVMFGYAVALSGNGDTLVVGAYDEDGGKGAPYVFARTSGTWSQQTRLQASNTETDDKFGSSIAISADGNTLALGAPGEQAFLTGIQNENAHNAGAKTGVPRTPGGADADSFGAAYVFVHNGGTWTQQAYIKATNTRPYDQFGWAIALSSDGNTLAVSAHLEDGGATGLNGNQADASGKDSGAVYVYTRSGTSWSPAAYVKASNARAYAEFGNSVALNSDGKVLAAGAPREDSAARGVNGNQADHSATNSGAAYVYY